MDLDGRSGGRSSRRTPRPNHRSGRSGQRSNRSGHRCPRTGRNTRSKALVHGEEGQAVKKQDMSRESQEVSSNHDERNKTLLMDNSKDKNEKVKKDEILPEDKLADYEQGMSCFIRLLFFSYF